MNPKLNSTVSVVKINDHILEFFLTNIRQQIRIKVNDDLILKIISTLDGTKSPKEIATEFDVPLSNLNTLLDYLRNKGILDNVAPKSDFPKYTEFRRIIHFLAEYSHSHAHLLQMWNNIRQSTVLVIGLGAVGSWVACNLAQSGVGKLLLMDNDIIEASNLPRQFSYTENTIGQKKIDVLANRLRDFNPEISILKKDMALTEISLHEFDEIPISLIINCADKPTVDATSLWVGEYSMQRGIPHIIGGGYNLHLSLIGQTVLPGRSACMKCFQKTLAEENSIDPRKVKKLSVKNRKIGSFGPMCSLIASMIGMEAIKVLSKEIQPANLNRRGEFNIYNMDIKYKTYERRDDCEWCGKQGKYYHS